MSISLDANLQAQLDGNERTPIVQIVSSSFASAIPFIGNMFGISNDGASEDNFHSDLISLSTGELVSVSVDQNAYKTVRFMITDANRLQWSSEYSFQFNLADHGGLYIDNLDCCEMPDGNIGIVYFFYSYGYKIRVTRISQSGTWVGTSWAVYTPSGSDTIYDPCIIYNPNSATYQIFFGHYVSSTQTYHLKMVESSNFTSWGTPTDISPTSLGTSKKYNRPDAYILSDDDVVLDFDYASYTEPTSGFETTNVYYMISQDDGATWTDATAVTAYTGTGKGARAPNIVQKSTGVIYCTFHDRETFVKFDGNTPGVLSDCGSNVYAQDIHVYNGRLYVSSAYTSMGYKQLCGMYLVDPSDMSPEFQYTSFTTPGYNTAFTENHSWWTGSWSDGKYLIRLLHPLNTCSQTPGDTRINMGNIFVVSNDGVTESTWTYVIGSNCDISAYGLDENVYIPTSNHWVSEFAVVYAWVDAANDRLYLWLYDGYLYCRQACYGWLDLTESPDPGTGYYTWNEIWRKTGDEVSTAYGLNFGYCLDFSAGRYCKEDDVVVLCGGGFIYDPAAVMVMDAQTGVIQFMANYTSNKNVPYKGVSYAYVYNQKIYGSFEYTNQWSQEEWRGLWIYDMVTGSRTLAQPGYETKDQYWFYDFNFNDIGNNNIWICGPDGAFRYHTGTQYFEPFTDAEIPGILQGNQNEGFFYIYYDATTEDVYVAKPTSYIESWWGVIRFNANGDYYKGQYQQGLKTLTDLNLTNQQDLTAGYLECDIASAVDEDDVLWCIWGRLDYLGDDRDFIWDNDESETDITDDLTDVLEISWDIEVPTECRFSLANGQRYDPQNTLSTLSYLFKRGRKVTPKLGENVNGTDYYVQQGVFFVEEVSMTYDKNNHPVLEVIARDISSLWQDARIVLTDFYDAQTPEYILGELLSDWTVLEGADYDIPTIATSHTVWNQWQDSTLYDIIKDILDHFEYVFHFTTAGVFTPVRLDFTKAVDHTYSTTDQISNYSPDSTFSSYVNQLRVIGETHDFLDIVYDPEEVGAVNGTCGWWDETIEHTVYYNKERTRKCRNPYLEVNISTGDFTYFLAKFGGAEYISYEDPEELYCIITVEGPNLIPVVVGLAAILLALGFAALGCDGFVTGVCGFYINAALINVNLLCMALLANATYDFTIWAMPLGKQKQTIQYIATDQSQMDLLNQQPVMEEIEDALCYTVAQCQRVAEYELNVIKYQRERIKLTKAYHLQDEIHDMLVVYHPYSGQPMQILVANLVRTMVIRGEVTDSIEGWRIA